MLYVISVLAGKVISPFERDDGDRFARQVRQLIERGRMQFYAREAGQDPRRPRGWL